MWYVAICFFLSQAVNTVINIHLYYDHRYRKVINLISVIYKNIVMCMYVCVILLLHSFIHLFLTCTTTSA